MNVFRFIYPARKKHSAENNKQYPEDYRQNNVEAICVSPIDEKANECNCQAYNCQQAIKHTFHRITSDCQKGQNNYALPDLHSHRTAGKIGLLNSSVTTTLYYVIS